MDSIAEIIMYSVLAAVFMILLYFFIINPILKKKEYGHSRFQKDSNGVKRKKLGDGTRSCPVCNEKLEAGMRVHSKLYKRNANEHYMHVYGCPFCWPENTRFPRVCPVCGKNVPKGGFLVARYYEKLNTKHVHVIGCSGCRRA